jgi:hypothetical protein
MVYRSSCGFTQVCVEFPTGEIQLERSVTETQALRTLIPYCTTQQTLSLPPSRCKSQDTAANSSKSRNHWLVQEGQEVNTSSILVLGVKRWKVSINEVVETYMKVLSQHLRIGSVEKHARNRWQNVWRPRLQPIISRTRCRSCGEDGCLLGFTAVQTASIFRATWRWRQYRPLKRR